MSQGDQNLDQRQIGLQVKGAEAGEKKKSSHNLPQNNYSVTFINEAFPLVTYEFVQFLLSETMSGLNQGAVIQVNHWTCKPENPAHFIEFQQGHSLGLYFIIQVIKSYLSFCWHLTLYEVLHPYYFIKYNKNPMR